MYCKQRSGLRDLGSGYWELEIRKSATIGGSGINPELRRTQFLVGGQQKGEIVLVRGIGIQIQMM